MLRLKELGNDLAKLSSFKVRFSLHRIFSIAQIKLVPVSTFVFAWSSYLHVHGPKLVKVDICTRFIWVEPKIQCNIIGPSVTREYYS